MMRTALTFVLLMSAATTFAQTSTGNLPPDPLDAAKTSKYYLRFRDEITAKQAAEAARRALKTPKFREALRNLETKAPELPIAFDRFITAGGIVFEAVQIGLSSRQLQSGAKVTLFGEVTDLDGKVITDFEEPARVLESKGDLFVERSVFLSMPKANAAFGVARGADVIGIARVLIDDEEIKPASPGVSRLIVSNNIYNLAQIQGPFDPFAFGGTKVVPKPDRAFRRSDEMWLFTEVRHPAMSDDGKPRLAMRISIASGDKTVANSKMSADASPLKGVDGHYGVGTAVDLSALRAGRYTVNFTVTDEIAHRSYERSETITVTD